MGGRGSSSGISVSGKVYGTEYKSLLTYGNIKFVVHLDNSATAPMETMTNNRVYVTLTPSGEPKCISYYDRENKRARIYPPYGRLRLGLLLAEHASGYKIRRAEARP